MWVFILQFIRRLYWYFVSLKSTASCRWMHAQVDGNLQSTRASKIAADFYLSWEWSFKKKHCCSCPATVEQKQLQRRVPATTLRFRPVWVVTYCWIAFFVFVLRMIPASIDGRRWYQLHLTVCVSFLLQLCIKQMRYNYHPQRNC